MPDDFPLHFDFPSVVPEKNNLRKIQIENECSTALSSKDKPSFACNSGRTREGVDGGPGERTKATLAKRPGGFKKNV